MIAGLATPAALYATDGIAAVDVHALSGTAKLVVSGRLLGANNAPLSGATVELWQPGAERASAVTDGDGRFFTTIEQAARPRQLRYSVSHGGRASPVRQLRFTREEMQRDDAGAWRASFGATLA